MQIAVVDQVQLEGAGTPRSIVLDESALARAEVLGRNVAEQIGRSFEEAEYRGDEPGACPLCHLDELRDEIEARAAAFADYDRRVSP